jgi:hypothetical protein
LLRCHVVTLHRYALRKRRFATCCRFTTAMPEAKGSATSSSARSPVRMHCLGQCLALLLASYSPVHCALVRAPFLIMGPPRCFTPCQRSMNSSKRQRPSLHSLHAMPIAAAPCHRAACIVLPSACSRAELSHPSPVGCAYKRVSPHSFCPRHRYLLSTLVSSRASPVLLPLPPPWTPFSLASLPSLQVLEHRPTPEILPEPRQRAAAPSSRR